MDKFKYTIREYNSTEKFIVVDYEDGSWARIAFMETIPANQSDLDSLVSRFTKTKEQMEVREFDDSFIKKSVGIENEAARFSIMNKTSPLENPHADVLEDLDNNIIEETVIRVLKEKGYL